MPNVRHQPDSGYLLRLLSKVAVLIGLLLLILLGSIRLFSSLRSITSHPGLTATPIAPLSSSANSTSAMFGFDLQHTHFNHSEHILTPTNVSRLVPSWIFRPGDVIYSSPAVANGVVYIGSDDGKLYALDSRIGSIRWATRTGNLITSSPAVANGVVYIGSWDNKLYACDARTGRTLWASNTGREIDSSPTVANGVVYVYSRDGKLYAFDPRTGSTLWSYYIGGVSASSFLIDSSPAIVNGMVYIGSPNHKVFAFHLMPAAS